MTRPIVAIVGRPNVGKSTLFNRLVGERLAIIEDLPGTTRDRVYADISWRDHELTLIDTGGLEPRPDSSLRQKVQDQAEAAIEEAEVIIFMVDVLDGVTVPDSEVAEALRRSQKPLLLAVNKADNDQRRHQAFQFHELGIGEPIAISAHHGTGVSDLMEEVAARLPLPTPLEEEPGMLKIAIVGRPNVGKSMLLNTILGQERAIVSETPGTTRDAIDTVFKYDGESVLFIDTAGIRRRGRVEGGIERYSVMRSLRAISRADVAVLVTEAAEVITAQDAHIAGYIHQALKGMVLAVNKWDLASELEIDAAACTTEILQRLKFFPGIPILFVSAQFGSGVDQVLPAAKNISLDRQKRLPTALLNEEVGRILAAHSPPSVQGRQLKVSYVTQAEVNPPTFVFFVNDPKLLHFSYQRYLENKLREAFGFSGTPLKLVFKRKGKG
ncbi:MAG: ribosome biogenesis GTPase Der [Dehalococcoidia bacterium]|nr:MAG: ribosome biogenesis GTPase Der [Dehalococcoidia bacterium]